LGQTYQEMDLVGTPTIPWRTTSRHHRQRYAHRRRPKCALYLTPADA